ncbi:hypothetical protein AWB80_04487 [Caballeronia pedi]|uniref:C2H2-type domain-containing protein n=1 Tax=Caballeronia pedi TaxID=1777141 RepID=A0A158C2A2_9BURK|nr:hypothetical protein [Caballeronia pedi]SAK76479.1 hypothetical protein AWB80_04487 [Caballeronia pedi]
MSGRFSFRHRLVQCPRCRRQVAADSSVCPHCDFHRKPKASRKRAPLRMALVVVLALLAIGGCLYLGESGIDTHLFLSR